MNLPFRETLLLDVAFVVLIVIFASIILFLVQRIWNFIREKDDKLEEKGCFLFLLKFLILSILLMLSLALIGFAALIQSFHSFTEQELIARVACEKINHNNYTLRLIITKTEGADAGNSKQFYVQGDEWFIRGDILTWKGWIKILSLHNWYRITEVGAGYRRASDKRFRTKTTRNLIDEVPTNWKWLYNFGKKLPLTKGIYEKRVFNLPGKNTKFEIFVTTSGFLIKVGDKDLYNE